MSTSILKELVSPLRYPAKRCHKTDLRCHKSDVTTTTQVDLIMSSLDFCLDVGKLMSRVMCEIEPYKSSHPLEIGTSLKTGKLFTDNPTRRVLHSHQLSPFLDKLILPNYPPSFKYPCLPGVLYPCQMKFPAFEDT
ncbi:hypothetical protein CEXT_461621 [Caerostris extrusa]|uniref:Uncharacterized protein n=1 Tax=Caerostris extrusa TaxID=172846 RepID=A0AAV4X4Y9_CAEEX|nr:hypothetical protein CEXT_461621 [Caerostris extrusa]